MITLQRKLSKKILYSLITIIIILSLLGILQLITITTNFIIELPHNLGVASVYSNLITYSPNLHDRIKQAQINTIVHKIYGLESSYGKHDSCAKINKYNGYGYSPGVCFDSHLLATKAVVKWVTLRYDWRLSTMLCYYNQGRILNDCTYYQNFLKLN